MVRFQIIGETPSKKNSKIITRSGKIIPSKQHSKWHTDALVQLYAQLSRIGFREPIERPVDVYINFYHENMIRRDSDNQASSIMDLLQDAGVLLDDRWQIVRCLSITNHYDKDNAHCTIQISEHMGD